MVTAKDGATAPRESLKVHEAANLVPRMRPDEWAAFLADVSRRGIQEPLVICGDTILDGRHRHEAAEALDIENVPIRRVDLSPSEQVEWLIKAAVLRRHLSDDQRAILADRFQEPVSKAAKEERASKAGKTGGRGRPKDDSLSDTATDKLKTDTRAQVAKQMSVPERKVKAAAVVRKADPKLADKVLAGDMPLKQAVRQVERAAKSKALEVKAKAAKSAPVDCEIVEGDCVRAMQTLEPGAARLIFADPPYNIGIDYGDGAKADKLPHADYLEWVGRWIGICHELLAADGSLWVMIGDEYAADYHRVLLRMGFTLRAWIKWYETFGVNCSNNFNRCSRHIFYAVKDPKRFVFNADAVNRPSDRQTKYGDKRADPGGKIWDDVWNIPRLVGTAAERIEGFPTQLPLELTRAIVGCASDPGDVVVDPFSGSASTGVACLELGRRFIGIEKSKEFVRLSRLRLRAAQTKE